MAMRCVLLSVGVFTAAALMGPLIRFAVWPLFRTWQVRAIPLEGFIYDLVLLLWPTGVLGIMEVNIGTALAVAVTIGANVLLFAVLGVAAGIVARRCFALVALYVFVCGLVILFELWGAGFDLAFVNVIALGVALALYAIPFCVVSRVGCQFSHRLDSTASTGT